jgi:hypothetical protein
MLARRADAHKMRWMRRAENGGDTEARRRSGENALVFDSFFSLGWSEFVRFVPHASPDRDNGDPP